MGWESTLTPLNPLHLLSSCLQVMVTGDLQYFLLLPETESPNVERRKVPEHLIIKRIMIWSFHLNRKYAVVSGLFIPRRILSPPSCQAYLTVRAFFAQGRGRFFLYQDLVSAYSSWMWQLCLPTRCQFLLTCQFSSKPKSCT